MTRGWARAGVGAGQSAAGPSLRGRPRPARPAPGFPPTAAAQFFPSCARPGWAGLVRARRRDATAPAHPAPPATARREPGKAVIGPAEPLRESAVGGAGRRVRAAVAAGSLRGGGVPARAGARPGLGNIPSQHAPRDATLPLVPSPPLADHLGAPVSGDASPWRRGTCALVIAPQRVFVAGGRRGRSGGCVA